MRFATALGELAPGIGPGLEFAAKVTLLLVIGLVVQNCLARWKASLGAAAGNASMIGLLALPLSVLVLPTITLTCLPAETSTTEPQAIARNVPDAASTLLLEAGGGFESEWPLQDRTRSGSLPKSAGGADAVDAAAVRGPDVSDAVTLLPASTRFRALTWFTLAILGYAMVAFLLLVRLMASLVAVSRLRHGSTPVTDGAWWLALERWRQRLGIKRPVGLAWSPGVCVPLVLGWARPAVVLPSSLSHMNTSNHADAILVHELSHVRRGDYRVERPLAVGSGNLLAASAGVAIGPSNSRVARTRLRRSLYS